MSDWEVLEDSPEDGSFMMQQTTSGPEMMVDSTPQFRVGLVQGWGEIEGNLSDRRRRDSGRRARRITDLSQEKRGGRRCVL